MADLGLGAAITLVALGIAPDLFASMKAAQDARLRTTRWVT